MNASTAPLRRRVTLALTLLGLLLSALFAVATVWVADDYEYVIATEILQGQAEDYGLRLSNGLAAQLPKTHRLSGYTAADVPARYVNFPLGVHEDAGNSNIHVGVFDTSAGRLYFTTDLSDIEALEAYLSWVVGGVVIVGTLLAGILGWYFAGAALKPLAALAQAVDALPVTPHASNLRAHVSNDALGRLAGAIDDYQRRLVEADAHEQAFFADASHELRTPIAVAQGAIEVILDDADAGSNLRQLERLHRLDRGVREMTGLVEMLLLVARHRALHFEQIDAAAFLREAVEPLCRGAAQATVEIAASGGLCVPRREALLLIRHAIGKLGWPSSGETLLLQLEGTRIKIASSVRDETSVAPRRSDAGGAGALAQRLAALLGWHFERVSEGCIRFQLPADTEVMDAAN